MSTESIIAIIIGLVFLSVTGYRLIKDIKQYNSSATEKENAKSGNDLSSQFKIKSESEPEG